MAEALDQARAEGIATATVFDNAMDAAAAVRNGDADALMKGTIDSSTFLHAVLDRHRGLRSGSLVSHVAVIEAFGRLLLLTDGGIVLNPTLDEKSKIIINSVPIANGLGIEMPKVAVLAAVEKVNSKMPETIDALALSQMDLPGCVVQGPLAMDNAVSPQAAAAKGITGPVAGLADVLLVPSVLAGNILAKGIMYFGGCPFGGVVAGTSRPVMFLSRSDTAQTKLNTIALGVLLSQWHGKE